MKAIQSLTACFLTMCLLSGCEFSSFKKFIPSNQNYSSYREAVRNHDFEAVHDSLDMLQDAYNTAKGMVDGFNGEENLITAQSRYYSALDYIYNAEASFLMTEIGGKSAADKIVFLLKEIPHEGTKVTEGLHENGEIFYYHTWSVDNIAYIQWVEHYNALCSKLLDLAINQKDDYLAQQILSCFVESIETIKGSKAFNPNYRSLGDTMYFYTEVDGEQVDDRHCYIKYSNKEKDAAQEKYQEAVNNGTFK